ncbi:Uncharacterised protein [Mycobacteroides abscessus subsp. abscessus]|nr:Uncharacterised protein [Mycobacteroides abscessus subsp. abscessus]SLI08711.1 Uncharacterised protein [Mycobacteroides abscessus subsp. massiliense]SIK07122.1 Uncharacterised protein [Mycobacteroides abscessus subsp. abscessus]SIK11738.1 Uncharacterised protein [Mycobacteroides abscessus subsp. abscessus]SIM12283.1 Uncharacterised protein [Mycobacteroides abscessus subsp. abscessus]
MPRMTSASGLPASSNGVNPTLTGFDPAVAAAPVHCEAARSSKVWPGKTRKGSERMTCCVPLAVARIEPPEMKPGITESQDQNGLVFTLSAVRNSPAPLIKSWMMLPIREIAMTLLLNSSSAPVRSRSPRLSTNFCGLDRSSWLRERNSETR